MKPDNMTNLPKIAALVPMRHHSERVPGKNYRSFAGQPLYRCIIAQLLQCNRIADVIIDTDSPIIKNDANEQFPTVNVIDRPERLRNGAISMNEVLLHDVQIVEADFYLQTHSTNPLLQAATISAAIDTFIDKWPAVDSLFSVCRLQVRLWDEQNRAVNHDPSVLLRTQDLDPIYEENSCLYIFTRDSLQRNNNRIGQRPMMFEIDRSESWDIDEEIDFRIAEILYNQTMKQKV